MIRSIDVRNFRCYDHLHVDNCARVNVIVGDNGAGKTALLEALFLTLSGNLEVSLRLRAQRGFDQNFGGTPRVIEEAIWKDYFLDGDWSKTISIDLEGSGPESRSLTIERGERKILIPTGESASQQETRSPLRFIWTDFTGKAHEHFPLITLQGIQLNASDEVLPDFHLFPANQVVPATQTAEMFSSLSREGLEEDFVSLFVKEFPFLSGLSIEVIGGLPVVHGTIANTRKKRPINAISGGINRTLAIMLTMATEKRSVVLVDEIENGIYYKHKVPIWSSILDLARRNDSQMFLSTHDEEWLEALVVADQDRLNDVAIWRLENEAGRRIIRQFNGDELKASIEYGTEIR
ncbi:AAA family ATPase [Mesorhizobium sp. YC-39]|uniref:AAA family ATPase n=1 Tax=unclassified Mesorhizobium TaxID=325217 RepID=UPI0021E70D05|nr:MULTISPECIES: AAA family ATPase [unclassified Mesorhizobium]MCV3209268.1 AAA family ATPase [Mesorhizobium sp. YC-2]MCV3231382.1 AAA family ATPase [Mesorhizobium sp. YC-39]